MTEKYLARTLKPKDLELLAWMYDELDFPADVIEYLIEYCVEKGNKKTEYLRSVAIGWHDDGIETLEQAKAQVRAFRLSTGNYYAVLRAFGIYGRAAVPREEAFVDRWTGEMGFPIEVIQLACAEAMRKNVKQPFDYTNKILEKWKGAGLKNPEDVKRYLARREERRHEENRQTREREVLAARRSTLAERVPEFEAVEAEILDLSAKRDLAVLNGADAHAEELTQKILTLRIRKAGLLSAAGFPEDYLDRI